MYKRQDYIDPFLMLDEFGSENKDDYLAGFPPHPHRGIETVTYMLNIKQQVILVLHSTQNFKMVKY